MELNAENRAKVTVLSLSSSQVPTYVVLNIKTKEKIVRVIDHLYGIVGNTFPVGRGNTVTW